MESPLQTTAQVVGEFLVRRVRGGCEGAHDELALGREGIETLGAQGAEPADDTMAEDGVADRSTDHEPDPCWIGAVSALGMEQVHDERAAPATSTLP